MTFWLKQITLIVGILLLGGVLLVVVPSLEGSLQNQNTVDTKSIKGLSAVYQDLKDKYQDLINADRKNYVIELNETKGSTLSEQLTKLEKITKPISGRWVGDYKSSRFTPGDTLKRRLEDISAEQGMNLVWWLDRDFVVKHPFRVEEHTLGTLKRIVTAIDSDFEMQVHGYFCPQQRALVITDQPINYMYKHCVKARA